MRLIRLNRGVALVDDEDYLRLSKYRWTAQKSKKKRNTYAMRTIMANGKSRRVVMHRMILGFPSSPVDHINGNGLDNRKLNLRLCTDAQNKWNMRPPTNGSSKYKGVRFHKKLRKWTAQISVGNKSRYLGLFVHEIDAAKAYDHAAIKLRGEYAWINFGGPLGRRSLL